MKSHIFSKHEEGQSLVELAMVFLLMVLIVAGIIDVGRILFTYLSMRDAAQEAAVYGAINPTIDFCRGAYGTELIAERARDAMNDPSLVVEVRYAPIGSNTWSFCYDAQNLACTGNQIKVTVIKYDYPITMPLIGAFIGSQTIDLRAEITGSILRPACQ